MLAIYLKFLVVAVESCAQELFAVLEQISSDLSAGAGEGIEGVEVDVGCYGDNDSVCQGYIS
jgi:hypothetical protein